MSKTYADALRYFRTKLKAGPEPVVTNLTTETEVMQHDSGEVETQLDGTRRSEHAGTTELLEDVRDVLRPEPEPASARLSSDEFITLPDGTKRRIRPQEPTADIYEWSHVMDYSVFRVKTPWRQAQLIAQWRENEAQGGKPVNLRGGAPRRNCFGCGKGPGFCDCEEVFIQ